MISPAAPAADESERSSPDRRTPRQSRARQRVAAIVDAAARLVVQVGADGLSMRATAEAAGMPVATLYQYFADRDAVLLAVIEREMESADRQVRQALADAQSASLHEIALVTNAVYVCAYRRSAPFAVAFLRGRTVPAVSRFARHHNARLARDLYEFGRDAGLLRPEADLRHVRLAVEVSDRIFCHAFARDLDGEPFVLEEGMKLVIGYLTPYTVPRGGS